MRTTSNERIITAVMMAFGMFYYSPANVWSWFTCVMIGAVLSTVLGMNLFLLIGATVIAEIVIIMWICLSDFSRCFMEG